MTHAQRICDAIAPFIVASYEDAVARLEDSEPRTRVWRHDPAQ